MAYPTQKYLQECLEYNAETGKLFWLKRPVEHFSSERSCNSWNGKQGGKEVRPNCIFVGIANVQYKKSRIIWLLVYGVLPNIIDHINGDFRDNRLVNLRNTDLTGNARNSARFYTNTSGVVGVSKLINMNAWRMNICNGDGGNGEVKYFPTWCEAFNARVFAEMRLGYHPNHGRSKLLS